VTRVLITDGEHRSVLAAARGLATAGFHVATTGPSPLSATNASLAVRERISLAEPLGDPEGFASGLEAILRRGQFDVLIPGTDASLLDISRHRDRFSDHARLGLPSRPSVDRALDKRELLSAAARHGLDAPRTVICVSAAEILRTRREIEFPVIVKPVRSVVERGGVRSRSPAQLVYDHDQLGQAIARFGEALVQERVDGRVVSYAGVFADGELLGEAVSRYARTWPAQAGSACFSQTIVTPPELRRRLLALLEDLGWEGLFELELLEPSPGVWQAIDMNPRLYGSLAVAIAAGANLPAVWCDHLLGRMPRPVAAAPGVYYRWTESDLLNGLWRLRHGEPRAGASVLRMRRHVVHPHARADDPGPAIVRLAELGGATVSALVARGGWRDLDWNARVTRVRGRRRLRSPGPVVVIGAGPNGLSVTSHLSELGIATRCFGEPLESWAQRMPEGMMLRSRRRSSSIAAPTDGLRIADYERAERRSVGAVSLSLQEFVDYGRWFQRQAAPGVERRSVIGVRGVGDGFEVRLADGERVPAARVVLATGVLPFTHRPAPFDRLSRALCSHAYDHRSMSPFAGRRVAVIGSGQSALECAALAHEAGAHVEVLSRAPAIKWLGDDTAPAAQLAAIDRVRASLSPPTDVGGLRTGWLIAAPDVFRRLPRQRQHELAHAAIGPAGSGWLRPRLEEVPISSGLAAVQALGSDDGVRLQLSDGSSRAVDHVLLGTGYRVDVRRYPFLGPDLLSRLTLAGTGYPILGPGLESTVPGMHFMGAAATYGFGPINRFVVGTWYSAPAVARRIAGMPQPSITFAF
jgi:predicted ATP-grasp superfamily ATP-dependent carboligase